jgi:hypothetical protein
MHYILLAMTFITQGSLHAGGGFVQRIKSRQDCTLIIITCVGLKGIIPSQHWGAQLIACLERQLRCGNHWHRSTACISMNSMNMLVLISLVMWNTKTSEKLPERSNSVKSWASWTILANSKERCYSHKMKVYISRHSSARHVMHVSRKLCWRIPICQPESPISFSKSNTSVAHW